MALCTYIPAAQHKTDTGVLTPLYRNWDTWHMGHSVAMVYTTTIDGNCEKGPILHKYGTQLLHVVKGDVFVTCISYNDLLTKTKSILEYETHILNDTSMCGLLYIPPMTWYSIDTKNCTNDATVLNMPSISWHPNKNDQIKVRSWKEAQSYKL
jgi:hypothetical protein